MSKRLQFILLVLMIVASAVAMAMRPTHRLADESLPVNLELLIPNNFADWQQVERSGGQIIDPQQSATIKKIYTQTLSRTYTNARGEYVMLSIAYGADQSDAKQLHYPEVCYPSQGFQISGQLTDNIKTNSGNIRVKRMLAVMGNRSEPLTYWSTVGSKVVVGGKETKLEQLRYGFNGKIPDGLLFRVSSISQNVQDAYQHQNAFVISLIQTLNADNQMRLAGLQNSSHQP
jgi:EpsI family protein